MSYHIKGRQTRKLHAKFIFISGGVISSVGKGITTSALAALLEARGYVVAPIKCDAYLNVDAGTIRPQEHGEVFVTEDGIETDQDLGNYERFMNTHLTRANYVTNGQIYQSLIQRERNFEFEGEDVEIVPHVPEEIIRRCEEAAIARNADFVIVEIGGTVGEYQNILFIEANRIMKYRDRRDVIHIHVAYLPMPPSIGEMKSKPMQTSVRLLNGSGIQPDFLVGRSTEYMDDRRKETLAWICSVPPEHIISAPDAKSIYHVPLIFEEQHFTDNILKTFGILASSANLKPWQELTTKIDHLNGSTNQLKVALVGKYFETGSFKLSDVYISVIESLRHAGWSQNVRPQIEWVSSLDIETKGADQVLPGYDAIVVPGGFGSRGVEGIIEAIRYAREHKVPYLGLCYGMQLACVEFARNVAGLKKANTTEIDPDSPHPIIHIMSDQAKKLLDKDYGASMRLGAWPCKVKPGSQAERLYRESHRLSDSGILSERHRHRYEFNNEYRTKLEQAGLVFSGTTPDDQLVEIIELPDHPYFLASQFHPEFTSRPLNPSPLFAGLIEAVLAQRSSK